MINWITHRLGTCSYYDESLRGESRGPIVVDVRELADKEGNDERVLKRKIGSALEAIREGKSVVVCCDRGVSRSNAVALGILMSSGMSYEEASLLLQQKLGAMDINLGLLREVRALFSPAPATPRLLPANLLITGASGFVGRALLPALSPAHKVNCLDRRDVDLARDLQLLDAYVGEKEIGFILHLAHPRMRNNNSALPEAVAMMRNILEVCRLNKIGVLYLSSLTVFSGHISDRILEANSSLELRPKGLYGETKFLCEELIRAFRINFGLEAIILRPAALYGKGMDRGAFLSKFFEAALEGKTIYTHRYRNGPPVFDFLHLDDCVSAIRRALEIRPTVPVNLGTGVGTSTFELARKITEIAVSSSPVQSLEIHDETCKVIASRQEAEQLLGWRAKIDLETGLKELCHDAFAQRPITVP